MVKLFETEEDKVKVLYLVASIARLGTVLDELCFTPLRDIQVFASKTFGSFTGPTLISTILVAGSFVSSLPFLAKVFNENETDNLQDLLKNCDKELGTDYLINPLTQVTQELRDSDIRSLEDFFQADLNKNHRGYLKATIKITEKRRLKDFFQRKPFHDIRYEFKPALKEILNADETLLKFITVSTLGGEEVIETQEEKKLQQDEAQLKQEKAQFDAQLKQDESSWNIDFSPKEIERRKAQKTRIQEIEARIQEAREKLKREAEKRKQEEEKQEQEKIASPTPQLTLDELLKKVNALDDDSKALLLKMIPEGKGKTLADGRKNAYQRVKETDAVDRVKIGYDVAQDISFNYWLTFFIFNMMYDNADSTSWNLKAQVITIAVGFAITVVNYGRQLIDWFKRKQKDKQSEEDLKQDKTITYASKALKHNQLITFFAKKLKEHNAKKLKEKVTVQLEDGTTKERYKYKMERDEVITALEFEGDPTPEEILNKIIELNKSHQDSWFKRFINKFFSRVKSIKEHEDLIIGEAGGIEETEKAPQNPRPKIVWSFSFFRKKKAKEEEDQPLLSYREENEDDDFSLGLVPIHRPSIPPSPPPQKSTDDRPKFTDKKSFVRRMKVVDWMSAISIGISFIYWVGSVTVGAIAEGAGVAAQAVTDFLNGLAGGIMGILSLVFGTILGIAYYNKKIKPQLEKAKEKLQGDYLENYHAIQILKELEEENTAIRKFLKSQNVPLLATLKGYADRAWRRITTLQTKAWTNIKKFINRTTTFVGKVGTGVLLFRFLPLAILTLAGISLVAAAPVLWPILAVGLAIGIAWGIMYTYKYIQERRIKSSQNFLGRIDITSKVMRRHNKELREQIGLAPKDWKKELAKRKRDAGIIPKEDQDKDEDKDYTRVTEASPELGLGLGLGSELARGQAAVPMVPEKDKGEMESVDEKTTVLETTPEPTKEEKKNVVQNGKKHLLFYTPPVSPKEKKPSEHVHEKAHAQEQKHTRMAHRHKPTEKT